MEGWRGGGANADRNRLKIKVETDPVGNPLRPTDRERKENRQRDMVERRRTYEVKRTEIKTKRLND